MIGIYNYFFPQMYSFYYCFFKDAKIFPYWKKKTVFVYDGGGCFFNLLINLSKQECEDFWVNGLAYSRSNRRE